jgi:hypothetical protein
MPSFQLLRPALRMYKTNFVTLACLFILPSLSAALGGALINDFKTVTTTTLAGVIILLLSAVWAIWSSVAGYYALVRLVRQKPLSIVAYYRGSLHYIPRLFGLSLLVLGLLICTAILIFPVFIFIRRYILAPFYLIDGNTGIRLAMQRSASATKAYQRSIWGTLLVSMLLLAALLVLSHYAKIIGQFASSLLSFIPVLMFSLRYKEIALQQPVETVIVGNPAASASQ